MNELESKKADRFGSLLAEYLEGTIITLREQAKFFRTKEWLKRQSASEIAALHGVCADKAIRLLEISRVEDRAVAREAIFDPTPSIHHLSAHM